MNRSIKTLAQETLLYALSDGMMRICGYVVFLVHTRILTPNDYGILTDFYGNYIAFLGIVYLLSMDMAYFRFVHQLGQQRTFNTVITLVCLTSLIFSLVLIGCIPKLAAVTHYEAYKHFFYYLICLLILDTLLIVSYAHLRVSKRTGWFLSVKFLQAFSHIVFSVTFLCFPSCLKGFEYLVCSYFNVTIQLNPLDAIFLANIGSNLVAMGFLLPNFRAFQWCWNHATVRMLLGYAFTSFFAMLFFRLNELVPRMLFRYWIPDTFYATHTKEEMLGNLGTSFKLITFITLGINAFKYAAEPFFFAHANRKDAKQVYSQTMYFFLLVSTMGLLLFSLNVDWIARLLIPNPLYRNTMDTVPYLAFVQVVLGVYSNLSIALKLSHKATYTSWIGAFGSLICLIAAKILLPRYGHWGCVYASLSSSITIALLGYYVGQKWYTIPYTKHGFVLLAAAFFLLNKVPLWPTYLAFLPPIAAYLLLNTTIVGAFFLIGLRWYRSNVASTEPPCKIG